MEYENDEKEPWYFSLYRGLPWFEENSERKRRDFPCPGKRLEEYLVNIEKVNFHSLSKPLLSREEFYNSNKDVAKMFLKKALLKGDKEDREKMEKGILKLLEDIYSKKEKEFFSNREIRILLNQYRDDNYYPFDLGENPSREEREEFERQRIVNGLRKHVLSCKSCIESYSRILGKMAEDGIREVIPRRKFEKLKFLGLVYKLAIETLLELDRNLLRIHSKNNQ